MRTCSDLRVGPHVVVNGVSARSGGGVTYLMNFARAVADLQAAERVTFLAGPSMAARLAALHPSLRVIHVTLPAEGGLGRGFWEQVRLPRLLRILRPDVLFCPANIDLWRRPCPSVVLVQNVLPFSAEGGFSVRQYVLGILSRRSLRTADRVILLSESAKQLVEERCGPIRVPVDIVPLGANEGFHASAQSANVRLAMVGWPRRYLLSVGDYNRHKNFHGLLDAFEHALPELPADVSLVICGTLTNPLYHRALVETVRLRGLVGRVQLSGPVPYEELPARYAGAEAYLQPALVEAFPHTLLEAMGCGCAVGASTKSAGPEVCGDAAIYFDPEDIAGMAKTIVRLTNDPGLRRQLAAVGLKRASQYSWHSSVRQTLEVVAAAAGGTTSGTIEKYDAGAGRI